MEMGPVGNGLAYQKNHSITCVRVRLFGKIHRTVGELPHPRPTILRTLLYTCPTRPPTGLPPPQRRSPCCSTTPRTPPIRIIACN